MSESYSSIGLRTEVYDYDRSSLSPTFGPDGFKYSAFDIGEDIARLAQVVDATRAILSERPELPEVIEASHPGTMQTIAGWQPADKLAAIRVGLIDYEQSLAVIARQAEDKAIEAAAIKAWEESIQQSQIQAEERHQAEVEQLRTNYSFLEAFTQAPEGVRLISESLTNRDQPIDRHSHIAALRALVHTDEYLSFAALMRQQAADSSSLEIANDTQLEDQLEVASPDLRQNEVQEDINAVANEPLVVLRRPAVATTRVEATKNVAPKTVVTTQEIPQSKPNHSARMVIRAASTPSGVLPSGKKEDVIQPQKPARVEAAVQTEPELESELSAEDEERYGKIIVNYARIKVIFEAKKLFLAPIPNNAKLTHDRTRTMYQQVLGELKADDIYKSLVDKTKGDKEFVKLLAYHFSDRTAMNKHANLLSDYKVFFDEYSWADGALDSWMDVYGLDKESLGLEED
jgi:hypothetical protein